MELNFQVTVKQANQELLLKESRRGEENLLKGLGALGAFLEFTYCQLKAVWNFDAGTAPLGALILAWKSKSTLLNTPPCTWRHPDGLT